MRFGVIAAVAACVMAAPASAAVIVNVPPEGQYGGDALNVASNQNFVGLFTLSADTTIAAASIIAQTNRSRRGDSVQIKIRADDNGQPASDNLVSVTGSLQTIKPYDGMLKEKVGIFAPITLTAGTYWFGMSSLDFDTDMGISTFGFSSTGVGDWWRLDGDDLLVEGRTNFSFKLFDQVTPLPEPGSWALMILGFGAVGGAMRRRSARPSFA